ncbi:ribosomal-protein-alanine N-acetyltransferase [Psychromicrobium silvestre]|uniref:[Ribosomal protein bS18]-alanine N-acetyltransferase n=1 Tax=Psychromicrobium silvestre TaxID=1645614 RepID=A0A7Y9LTB8_9MICC|nr:ribosomal protein S18-alanine N-acetyltransferase [Psychromicrobium silvestre]NYE95207.1 ribosomal-protein-alanine N-acetyltransferase [Psychromicrobium silvestre]
MSSATLRAMTSADIDLISELENRLFPEDAWPRQAFVEELAQPSRHYLVAEKDGQAVGYAGLMCLPPTADVQTIGVLPEFEGQGIGSSLLTALIDEARRQGASDVLLEVRADNPRAQQLYQRFGFLHVHTRPRYYRGGIDALIMQLSLLTEEEVR